MSVLRKGGLETGTFHLELRRSGGAGSAAGGFGADFGEQIGAGEVEVPEGELAGEREPQGGAGDEGSGGEGEQGAAAGFRQLAEAVPGGGGDAAQLAGGEGGEIEQDEGQVAVAQQQVGGLHGLRGFAAAQPEQAGAFVGGEGGGIEAVAGVDEDEGGLRIADCGSRIVRGVF